jgi:DNA repair protein RadD
MQLRPYQQDAIRECWQALKANDEPVLLMASVGAGKSILIAHLLLTMQQHGKRALCLVNNAELVRSNHATFERAGGQGSIWCAALGSKDCSANILFGTPKSVLNGITKNTELSEVKFNLIVVDEAHMIDYNNAKSTFMRILRYYKQQYPDMRLLGATGTNYRFKGTQIVGDKCLFKSQVGNITTSQLIDEGYLVPPRFQVEPSLVIDFTGVRVKSNGQFDSNDLQRVVNENTRLTEQICKQIIRIMDAEGRTGCFLFATTRAHAHEILSHLPPNESAIILGDTPEHERTVILNKARQGVVRYLVNISIVAVGVDVPAYDTLAYLRPTESLVLMTQTMGRVLRLSPATLKTEALVLDYAGNIARHRDWDDPIIMDAVAKTLDEDEPRDIQCPVCFAMNTQHARRCVGVTNKVRCDFFFEFKPCPECDVQNDIAARFCRACKAELIDPNDKLSLTPSTDSTMIMPVLSARYRITGTAEKFRLTALYECRHPDGHILPVAESYCPVSEKAQRVFYGQFVKKHAHKPSDWYEHLGSRPHVSRMLNAIRSPDELGVVLENAGYKIKRKVFADSQV